MRKDEITDEIEKFTTAQVIEFINNSVTHAENIGGGQGSLYDVQDIIDEYESYDDDGRLEILQGVEEHIIKPTDNPGHQPS
jgi:hypothetical protein